MMGPMRHADTFRMLDRVSLTPTEPLGPVVTWEPGIEFKCLLTLDTSMKARIAEQANVTALFYGLVEKDVPITFDSVFERISDGAVFRVTSKPEDKGTPAIASFSLKAFTAERYNLPTE